MNAMPRILSTRAWFFRDGDAFTLPEPGGTASRTDRPADDDSAWIDFGAIVDGGIEREREPKEVWGPFTGGGRIELHDVVETKQTIIRSFITQEMSPLAIEVLFGSAALDELSEDFYALAGKTKKGWILIDHYDHRDVLTIRERAFVHLYVAGPVTMDSNIASVPFEAQQLTPSIGNGLELAGLVEDPLGLGSFLATDDGFILTEG
jgi:hypothetical protein